VIRGSARRALARLGCWLRGGHDPELRARLVVEGQLVQIFACRRCEAPLG